MFRSVWQKLIYIIRFFPFGCASAVRCVGGETHCLDRWDWTKYNSPFSSNFGVWVWPSFPRSTACNSWSSRKLKTRTTSTVRRLAVSTLRTSLACMSCMTAPCKIWRSWSQNCCSLPAITLRKKKVRRQIKEKEKSTGQAWEWSSRVEYLVVVDRALVEFQYWKQADTQTKTHKSITEQ